ncbi:MAG: tryptophan synthase subunit alpha [Proteobacteria bacterium]|nr:tryptophan synthase subunit alpha [Pseudomonadota bacterium]
MSRLAQALRRGGRAALVPYITAGDPSLPWTQRFVAALAEAGADVIELGVPFSDPIADGPVIQRASERALKAKTTLPKVLGLVRSLRRRGVRTPIVLFSYLNPILRLGPRAFAARARAAGVDGVLVVDLPPEEGADLREALAQAGVEAVFLASPTTDPARLGLIDSASTGFVYYVSRLGVTGARSSLSASLPAELARLRRRVKKPVAVGFGISTPEQAKAVARLCDGVVVGSALMKIVEEHRPAEAVRRLGRLATSMCAAMKDGRKR